MANPRPPSAVALQALKIIHRRRGTSVSRAHPGDQLMIHDTPFLGERILFALYRRGWIEFDVVARITGAGRAAIDCAVRARPGARNLKLIHGGRGAPGRDDVRLASEVNCAAAAVCETMEKDIKLAIAESAPNPATTSQDDVKRWVLAVPEVAAKIMLVYLASIKMVPGDPLRDVAIGLVDAVMADHAEVLAAMERGDGPPG